MEIEQLGPYRLGKRIGKGGMGSVYEAVEDGSGKRVAVKALSPQLAMAEGFRERFESEIESLKILQHAGIVQLLGYGEDNGTLFYSMELVDGPSLEQELAAGRRFDWRETLQIGIQVCRALKHAHDHGVVHRDVKPANLLLTPENRVKIADFGIARLFGATQLTTAGGVLGTADYMSPEQADGRPVTEKCDQYSLGCVMYALLAGRPPFRAKSMPEMLQMQRFAEPEPVRRYAPQTPVQLESLIKQLLSKEPDDRFPNVLVLARHMEAMEKALSRPGKTPAEPDRSPPAVPPAQGTAADQSDLTVEQQSRYQPGDASLDLVVPEDVYSAPTLGDPDELELADLADQEEMLATRANTAIPNTPHLKTPHAESLEPEPPIATEAPAKRFTTVAEEARRQRSEQHGDRLARGLQLAGLFAALAAVIGVGYWLLRPASADQLYETIQSTLANGDGENLRDAADPLEEFAARYPDDPRQGEFADYYEELEMRKLERQLRARSRLASGGSLHPIEQVYGEAIAIEEQNPARAGQMLSDLLALYETNEAEGSNASADESKEEVSRWLALVKRQLKRMQTAAAAQAERQLPILEARLAAARRLEAKNPTDARRTYAALIRLYENQPWAREIVQAARTGEKRCAERMAQSP